MAEPARHPITIDDDEGRRLHAKWSRSGKRLIVTVTTSQAHAQVEMTPQQLAALAAFLSGPTAG
jgi:hypothetical protein